MLRLYFDCLHNDNVLESSIVYIYNEQQNHVTIGDLTLEIDDTCETGSIIGNRLIFNKYNFIAAYSKQEFKRLNQIAEELSKYACRSELERFVFTFEVTYDYKYFKIGNEFLSVRFRNDWISIFEFDIPKAPNEKFLELPGSVIYQPDYRKLSTLEMNESGAYCLIKRNNYQFYSLCQPKIVVPIYQYKGTLFFDLGG